MSTVQKTALIEVVTNPLREIEADLLVVLGFDGDEGDELAEIDRATGGQLSRARASREFRGKAFETFITPITGSGWRAPRVLVMGAGKRADYGPDTARKTAAAAALAARQRHAPQVAFAVPGGAVAGTGGTDEIQAVSEGLTLAEFDPGSYKTGEVELGRLERRIIAVQGRADASKLTVAAERGRILGECSNLARGLANEPANALPPRVFAERAAAIAGEAGARVEILDERQIAALNMGLLLGVAQGSHEPPRLIVITYDPPGAPPTPVLGLVGKGITFDTGGISIKPADGMDRMKDDMAGGAAVVAALRAVTLLGAPIRVLGVVPAAENMPGGRAIRPGDVLTGASGKTVEVVNTDAEGRLILGDALWYVQKLGATHLVDVATLTGACVVALGKTTTGLFGTPDVWVEHVRRVANDAGDRSWPMPTFDDYRDQLKSDIADLMNTGGRPAGAITAAMFVKDFTGGLPWVHMDIAGTAWAEEGRPFQPKGPTGVAVRTLAELAFTSGEWPV